MKKHIITLLIVILHTILLAQSETGGIKGTVLDNETDEPLIAASVVVIIDNSVSPMGVTTDLEGKFELNGIPVGVHQLQISYVGYEENYQNIKIKSGEILTINATLNQSYEPSPVIVVSAIRNGYPYIMDDELLAQVPAAYDDPARAFTQKIPLLNVNDQGNTISVRGNSPNGVKWYLNNVEIPNPNHTPNAGTAQDRITYSGGGVNMLKPEFLTNTSFQYSGKTNALGGVLSAETDKLVNPYHYQERKTAIKIGLIGLEAMTVQDGSTFGYRTRMYAGFRYSTVGLLTNGLGVDFGGEKISFWDYNINITAHDKKYGDKRSIFQLYSVMGSSRNIFEAQRDSSVWNIQKDRFDIDFQSFTSVTGLSHEYSVEKGVFKSTAMLASWNTSRNSYQLDDGFNRTLLEKDSMQHFRVGFHFSYHQNKAKVEWLAGLNITYLDYRLENFDSLANFSAIGNTSGWLFEPKLSIVPLRYGNFSSKLTMQGMYYSYNTTYGLQPSIQLKYDFQYFEMGHWTYPHGVQFNYSLQNQIQNPDVYLSRNTNDLLINQSLGFSKAHHFDFAYERNLLFGYSKTTFFYQSLFDIPIVDDANSTFSVLNDINSFINDTLVNSGRGRNYGIELFYEYKNRHEDFYITLNGSLYESTYTAGDNQERDSRFNGNFISNLTIGKEWEISNSLISKKKRKYSNGVIGAYFRGLYAGGLRETPIDIAQSQMLGRTVFVENMAYSLSQGNVFRIDARFYWKSQKYREDRKKVTHTVAIDIQNLTNQQNVAFRYFDVLQGEVITKFQLGLIPLLSWKVEF